MQRFFIEESRTAQNSAIDLTPIHHQLTRVLRAEPGTELLVLDNAGSERLVTVTEIDRRSAQGKVREVRAAPPEPGVSLTLYQCSLKADRFEWVLQKGVELGAYSFLPVVAERSVVRPAAVLERKRRRWETIVREAAEQSGRGRLPLLHPAADFADAVKAVADDALKLIAWEGATDASGIIDALSQAALPVQHVCLLIGPEGGLTAQEVEQANAAGWQTVTLGPRILRAETAALAGITLVMGALGELGRRS